MTPWLTVAYITSRHEPELPWFLQSLARQTTEAETRVIIVTPHMKPVETHSITITNPKPTVWQGPHRLTKQDWWAASNARNTAICLCQTEWIAFVDDRLALGEKWMEAVRDASRGQYAVCGTYEKVHNLVVDRGVVKSFEQPKEMVPDGNALREIKTGKDNRLLYCEEHYYHHKSLSNPFKAPGEWWYGCSTALPLEWALAVNGYDESCDGLSGEDSLFGKMLENNGYPIRYDTRLMVYEDRTPGKLEPVMVRKDKGVSPNDKSHWQLNMLKDRRKASHQWDLRQLRANALAGKGFPVSSWPNKDPYDGEPLAQMLP